MKLEGEIAKFGKAKVELSKDEARIVTNYMGKLIPDFVKETGGILSDTVRYWRWRNQIKIVMRAKAHLDNISLEPKVLPLKVIVPLLENASLEEDEIIQEMWARLLATAISDQHTIVPNHIFTLKQLSPVEVKVLDWMYNNINKVSGEINLADYTFSPEQVQEAFSREKYEVQLILEDLSRLGLLLRPRVLTKEVKWERGHGLSTNFNPNCYHFGEFGLSFMKVCKEGPIHI